MASKKEILIIGGITFFLILILAILVLKEETQKEILITKYAPERIEFAKQDCNELNGTEFRVFETNQAHEIGLWCFLPDGSEVEVGQR